MSQLRHSGWQHKRGKVGRGARSWRWRKGTTTDAVDPERENGAQSSAGAGVQEQLLEAGWESCWGLGRGGSGRGGERVWSQTRSGVKATAAEDEARPGKEPKAEGERQRRKHPGSEPGRRAESREEEGHTVPQEAEAGQSQAAAAAGAEAPGAKTESWEHGQTTAGGGRDGKAANTGFGG